MSKRRRGQDGNQPSKQPSDTSANRRAKQIARKRTLTDRSPDAAETKKRDTRSGGYDDRVENRKKRLEKMTNYHKDIVCAARRNQRARAALRRAEEAKRRSEEEQRAEAEAEAEAERRRDKVLAAIMKRLDINKKFYTMYYLRF